MSEDSVKIRPLLLSLRKMCSQMIRTDQTIKRSYTTTLVSRLDDSKVYPPFEQFLTAESLNKLYFNALVDATIRKELFM